LKVTLDTNILHQEGFNSQDMQVLQRLIKSGKVELIICELVIREHETKRTAELSAKMQSITAQLNDIKKMLAKSGASADEINEVTEALKTLKEKFHSKILFTTSDWVEKCGVTILKPSAEIYTRAWDDYFCGAGAFKSLKSREDIPDAIIGLSMIDYAVRENQQLSVICKDGQLKQFLKREKHLSVYSDLSDLIASDDIQIILNDLDRRDETIELFKKKLGAEDFSKHLMSYISADKSDLYYSCWDEEFDNAELLPTESLGLISANSPNLQSIRDVRFGAVNCISPKHYVIPLTFDVQLTISYAGDYGEWCNLDDINKNEVDCQSMNGDGVCDLSTIRYCTAHGQIAIHFLEDLSPADLSIHAAYLGSDNSPLDIEYYPGKIIL